MAGMWWKVPGGLLGIMAGGEAVAPEEAEVGTYPWFRGAMLRALKGNGFKNIAPWFNEDQSPKILSGYFEPEVLRQVNALYPGRSNKIYIAPHGLATRWNKDGQKPWETLDLFEAVMNDRNSQIIRNYSRARGSAPYGVLANDESGYVFSPLEQKKDSFYLKTVFRPNKSQLQRLGISGGSCPSSSLARYASSVAGTENLPVASSQQSRFSVDADAREKLAKNKNNVNETSLVMPPFKVQRTAQEEGSDDNHFARQIGIGARSLLSGALDGLSLGLAMPGTTLSDYLGLPKPEKGTPEELVSGLIRGAADMAPAIYSRGQAWQRLQQRIQKLKCSGNILRLLLTCRPGWGDWRDFSMSWEKVEVINNVSRRLQYSTGSEYQYQRY